MADRHDRREPCPNCPFRCDAPLAHWTPDHYLMLGRIEAGEHDIGSSRLFACHKDKDKPSEEQGLCVGWMLDQRKRGVRSLALRMSLGVGKNAEALSTQFVEMTGEADCYESVDELVRLNIEADRELHPERYVEDSCDHCGAEGPTAYHSDSNEDRCDECFE